MKLLGGRREELSEGGEGEVTKNRGIGVGVEDPLWGYRNGVKCVGVRDRVLGYWGKVAKVGGTTKREGMGIGVRGQAWGVLRRDQA